MAKRRRRASRASKPRLVRARAFELVDEHGQVVARLGPMLGAGVEDKGVGLLVIGATGETELAITVDSSGPAVHLSADGMVRLSLAVVRTDGGGSTVLFAARDSRGREVFATSVGEG